MRNPRLFMCLRRAGLSPMRSYRQEYAKHQSYFARSAGWMAGGMLVYVSMLWRVFG